jgi:NAD(P)-dependent dehydrogenase (short-subunit alcohol dehydrogenase family)
MDVWVAGRTIEQVEAVAAEVSGHALVGDVSRAEDVERWVSEVGDVDLLVCNAGMYGPHGALSSADSWWRVFEVNVLGVYLCCEAVAPRMVDRGGGRIVNVGAGAGFMPPNRTPTNTAYPSSKAAVNRFTEMLAEHLAPQSVFVFAISPGLVRTQMSEQLFGDDAPWASPEAAPRLVRALATGEFDALSGRFLHAEDDRPDVLRQRVEQILAADLNAIRLRRAADWTATS